MVGVVIVGAGEGTRFGPNGRKQFARVNGRPLMAYTIEPFERSELINDVVLVVPRESTEWVRTEIVEPLGFKKVREVVPGGDSRQQSVFNGLKALSSQTEKVIIHDAVRPLVSEPIIKRLLDAARKTGAAITAVPAKDTVKEVESGDVIGTLDRRLIWLSQTPQCFSYQMIMESYRQAIGENFEATDDAGLVEKYGHKVTVAVGSYANIKVTSPEDLPLMEYFLRQNNRMKLETAGERQEKSGGRPRGRGGPRARGGQEGGARAGGDRGRGGRDRGDRGRGDRGRGSRGRSERGRDGAGGGRGSGAPHGPGSPNGAGHRQPAYASGGEARSQDRSRGEGRPRRRRPRGRRPRDRKE